MKSSLNPSNFNENIIHFHGSVSEKSFLFIFEKRMILYSIGQSNMFGLKQPIGSVM